MLARTANTYRLRGSSLGAASSFFDRGMRVDFRMWRARCLTANTYRLRGFSTSSLFAPPARERWSFSCAPALVSERGIARCLRRMLARFLTANTYRLRGSSFASSIVYRRMVDFRMWRWKLTFVTCLVTEGGCPKQLTKRAESALESGSREG